jgi:ElaB/YqjD/DUF883 family membrane-anchored ribosome-binding protein
MSFGNSSPDLKTTSIEPESTDTESDMQMSEIESQLKKLSGDIAALTKTIAGVGADTADTYRAKVGNFAHDAVEASQNVMESARKDFMSLEGDVVTRIRARPLQALGIAVGVGFLLAFATRR